MPGFLTGESRALRGSSGLIARLLGRRPDYPPGRVLRGDERAVDVGVAPATPDERGSDRSLVFARGRASWTPALSDSALPC